MVHLVPQFLVVAIAIFLLTVSVVVSSKRIRYSINRRPQGLGSDNDCGFSLYNPPAFQPKTGARATCEKLVASIGLHLELLEFDIEAEKTAQPKLNPSIPYVIPFKTHQNSIRFKKHISCPANIRVSFAQKLETISLIPWWFLAYLTCHGIALSTEGLSVSWGAFFLWCNDHVQSYQVHEASKKKVRKTTASSASAW